MIYPDPIKEYQLHTDTSDRVGGAGGGITGDNDFNVNS